MKIPMAFARQQTDYTCGPASLGMVLRFLGDRKSERFLMKEADTSEDGTWHKGMIEAATRQGFYCYVNADSTLYEVKNFISYGLPVIVDYTEPTGNYGHYAVIVGYKKNKIIMNDPWNGKDFSMPEKEFVERWSNRFTRSKAWIMVISDEDMQMGKQYLPVK